MNTLANPLTELMSFLDAAPEPHIVFDHDYRILAANLAYRTQLADGQSVVGRTCYQVSHHYTVPCDQAGESCPLAKSRQSGRRERVLHLHHTPKGEEYVNIELTPIQDKSGATRYFVERMEAMPVARGVSLQQTLVGRAPSFQRLLELVSRVAKSEAVVLLEGESGTGKELVAQAIHQASRRANGPFIAVDCSGIPETLFESELFGHERGAFTGANARKTGLLDAASGGTLFLDEVGEIPLAMQVKLLRLLETSTYRRVGDTELQRTDIRVVSATHRSLRQMVAAGTFRADLFYRLNTFPIAVPALRERIEDISLLVNHLLSRVAPTRKLSLSEPALSALENYDYPGNIRELRNLLERASLMCDGELIEPEHLPPEVTGFESISQNAYPESVDELEQLTRTHKGSRLELAKKLGISERTLYRRLKSLSPGHQD